MAIRNEVDINGLSSQIEGLEKKSNDLTIQAAMEIGVASCAIPLGVAVIAYSIPELFNARFGEFFAGAIVGSIPTFTGVASTVDGLYRRRIANDMVTELRPLRSALTQALSRINGGH